MAEKRSPHVVRQGTIVSARTDVAGIEIHCATAHSVPDERGYFNASTLQGHLITLNISAVYLSINTTP